GRRGKQGRSTQRAHFRMKTVGPRPSECPRGKKRGRKRMRRIRRVRATKHRGRAAGRIQEFILKCAQRTDCMRTGLVIAALASAGCAAGGSHEWESLFDGKTLAGWEKAEFGGDGEVSVKAGNLVLGSGAGLTGLRGTHAPQGPAYEVELEAMRVDGNDIFCGLTFPVKGSSA